MRFIDADTRVPIIATRVAVLLLAAGLIGGCQTASGPGPGVQSAQAAQAPAPEPQPPMTRARAAEQCWMMTEKGHASASIDKRADIVTKCIDDKMKAAAAAPKT